MVQSLQQRRLMQTACRSDGGAGYCRPTAGYRAVQLQLPPHPGINTGHKVPELRSGTACNLQAGVKYDGKG